MSEIKIELPPAKDDMDSFIHIRLTKTQRHRLTQLAKSLNLPVSKMVRDMLMQIIDQLPPENSNTSN
jgi:antitoxin component of RelBE/YafQ-DinJ toxin-antitoxin module